MATYGCTLMHVYSSFIVKGFKHSTAKSYISAISYYCKLYHNSDPTKTFIVHKLLQGMKRSNPSTDSRLPITLDILNILLPKLQIICLTTYEAALFKAAFTLAFSALLRIGEFALSKGNSPQRVIHVGDTTFSSDGELIKLCIRHSKTDQQGYGTSVAVHATSGIACPVAAI